MYEGERRVGCHIGKYRVHDKQRRNSSRVFSHQLVPIDNRREWIHAFKVSLEKLVTKAVRLSQSGSVGKVPNLCVGEAQRPLHS